MRSKAIYLAVLPDGSRDILGLRIQQTECAKFWKGLQRPQRARLPGHSHRRHRRPEGDERSAGRGVSGDDPANVHSPSDSPEPRLRELAGAEADGGRAAHDLRRAGCLHAFELGPCGQKFPTVVASWRRAWTHVIPFCALSPEVRRVVYTTDALDNLNAQPRKIIETRGHFPTDEAATNLIWSALRNITAKWARGPRFWREALN